MKAIISFLRLLGSLIMSSEFFPTSEVVICTKLFIFLDEVLSNYLFAHQDDKAQAEEVLEAMIHSRHVVAKLILNKNLEELSIHKKESGSSTNFFDSLLQIVLRIIFSPEAQTGDDSVTTTFSESGMNLVGVILVYATKPLHALLTYAQAAVFIFGDEKNPTSLDGVQHVVEHDYDSYR